MNGEHIYILSNPDEAGSAFKIGHHTGTAEDLARRYRTPLRNHEIHLFYPCEQAEVLERKIHGRLGEDRLRSATGRKSEWYRLPLDRLIEVVISEAKTHSNPLPIPVSAPPLRAPPCVSKYFAIGTGPSTYSLKVAEVNYEIRRVPVSLMGQDFLLGLNRMLTEVYRSTKTIPKLYQFSFADLCRAMRKGTCERLYIAIGDWINTINDQQVSVTGLGAGTGESFQLFESATLANTRPAAVKIVLSDWYIAEIKARAGHLFDFERYNNLVSPTAKGLVPLLYALEPLAEPDGVLSVDCVELAAALGLAAHGSWSTRKQQFVKPLDQLKEFGYLNNYKFDDGAVVLRYGSGFKQ